MNGVIDFAQLKQVEFSEKANCNTTDEVILAQVAQNIRRGLPQIHPHPINPHTALLVCGGPSLRDTEAELVEAHWRGGKIIACNGSYQWCIERNLKPSAAVMLDAREFNSRFIETPVFGCKYLLAAQCHPRAFDLCRDRETILWHVCTAGQAELDLINAYYFERCFPVVLGVTVGIRAIQLLRMLGFTSIEIFGLDSCWLEGHHHGYEQPENNRDGRRRVWLRPKGHDAKAQRFECAPWHVKQADDFMKLIRDRGNMFQLNVHGKGLLAAILRTGAEIQAEE
jgi:hypothetical protein